MCLIFKIVLLILFSNVDCLANGMPKIGIVGGGIAGTSVAYFLQELFGNRTDKIDIFEYQTVGGRIALENVQGCQYEAGGTIIHPRNKYMSDLLKLCGLKKKQEASGVFGLYNGDDFVFVEDSKWSFWNTLKLFWRYGLDTWKLNSFIKKLLEHFSRIYIMQENKQSFDTVEDMLKAMNEDFVKYLSTSTKQGFQENGFSHKLIDELVMATLLVNYGQSTDVHELVGAVSVAGAMPGLWGVKGGNRQIPLKLLKMSNATMIKGQVSRITLMPDNKYQISFTLKAGDKKADDLYDIVIIATPLAKNMKASIDFVNFSEQVTFSGEMHQTVATFVVGDLNTHYFGLNSLINVNEIFSIRSDLFFNSIGEIHPIDSSNANCSKQTVWKIFSQNHLERSQLELLFVNIKKVKSITWLAYPKYSIKPPKMNFILNDNLYYINAIEWAASAMEMSLIGAKNVALLAFKGWDHEIFKRHIKIKEKNEL